MLRLFQISIGDIFKLGTVRHGPGKFRFYGMSIRQLDNLSVTIDTDEKLEAGLSGHTRTS